jgi:hypothetical protein
MRPNLDLVCCLEPIERVARKRSGDEATGDRYLREIAISDSISNTALAAKSAVTCPGPS